MPVHVLGNMSDMERLEAISKKHNLAIVEDATESLGSYYKGRHSGTFGVFGCLSFNGNKIITTGGGGMILTNDEALAKKAKHITTQAKSDPFEYVHDEIGYNYRLVNLLAAMGVAQMEQLPQFLIRKTELAKRYITELSNIPGFSSQYINGNVKANNWLQTFKFDKAQGLMKHLTENKIQVRPFWVPMNQLSMYKNEIYFTKNNVADTVYKSCVSLPCSSNLTDNEQEIIIKSVKAFYGC